MPYPYKVRFEGRGQSLNEYGILRVLNGRVFLCDADLSDYIKEWDGLLLEVGFWVSEDSPELPPDPLVWPLVEALQALGVKTLSSCQGHLDRLEQEKYPYVSFYSEERPAIALASGWDISSLSTYVWRLRTVRAASSAEELEELQQSINEQVAALG